MATYINPCLRYLTMPQLSSTEIVRYETVSVNLKYDLIFRTKVLRKMKISLPSGVFGYRSNKILFQYPL
jgi:hypothetical protein